MEAERTAWSGKMNSDARRDHTPIPSKAPASAVSGRVPRTCVAQGLAARHAPSGSCVGAGLRQPPGFSSTVRGPARPGHWNGQRTHNSHTLSTARLTRPPSRSGRHGATSGPTGSEHSARSVRGGAVQCGAVGAAGWPLPATGRAAYVHRDRSRHTTGVGE